MLSIIHPTPSAEVNLYPRLKLYIIIYAQYNEWLVHHVSHFLIYIIITCLTIILGGRTKETIVAWLKKKSGPPAVAIAAKEDMEKLLKENIAVVGYFAVSVHEIFNTRWCRSTENLSC